MKRFLSFFPLILLSSCSRLSELKHTTSPDEWLNSHPHWNVSFGSLNFVFAEPSSTFFVFLLGIILFVIGVVFLKKQDGIKSMFWWGWCFIIWALSTFSAGVSYQAFSYEIKCAGQELCSWTSWWEVFYLLLFVFAVNLILVAVAHSSSTGKLRKIIHAYAVVTWTIYATFLLIGAFIPNRFLVSFEFMVLFTSPIFIILLIVNLKRYRATKEILEIRLVLAWIFMFLIVVLYFASLMSGFAEALWQQGIWFNANDVLHITLIAWAIYLFCGVAKYIKDYD